MGVIAPEHKGRKASPGSNGFMLIVLLVLVVGIPVLVIKNCTSKPLTVPDAVRVAERVPLPAETEAVDDFEHDAADLYAGHAEGASYGYGSGLNLTGNYVRDSSGLYELTGPVMDTAHVLTPSDFNALNGFLLDLNDSTGIQIAVLTVGSLGNKSIEEFSIAHAEKWRLGQAGKDNGALLTVAMAERELRIETGYGTEGILTDAVCARIIRNVIIPEFQRADYSRGIVMGVRNMAGVIMQDESLVSKSVSSDSANSSVPLPVAVFMAVFLIVYVSLIVFGIRHNKGRVHVYVGPGHIPGGPHRGGPGGGGFSGGFRGGGGGFGGGGASGRW